MSDEQREHGRDDAPAASPTDQHPVPSYAGAPRQDAASIAGEQRLNPLGGAIAVGHPLGASGTVLMTRMLHHMRAHDIRYGLQTMCEGGGTANATIVELLR